ncbi:MAG: LytR family transcriptional regulator [Ruminococcaceae bacterium]|nr:LytR family transcriptional regulator [Oscillospiraceae bacterium]
MKEKEIIINRMDSDTPEQTDLYVHRDVQSDGTSEIRRRMNYQQSKRRRRASKGPKGTKKNGLIMLMIIISIMLILGIIGWGISNIGFNPDDPNVLVDDIIEDKVSVLLVGADGGGYNTDTIMLALMDCKNHTVNIMSIPRDTRVSNPYGGRGYAKINSVYAAKGMSGLIEQVGEVTGLPVNFYVKVDFEGFREAIDILGGVRFDVPMRLYYKDPEQNLLIDLQPGEQLLDGAKSEQLVRSRNQYAQADIKRTEVQREFLKALISQHANASNLLKVRELYNTMSKYVKTNITLGDAIKYAPSLTKVDEENINMYILPGTTNEGAVSYWLHNPTEMENLANNVFWYNVKVKPTPRPTKTPTPTPTPSATPTPTPDLDDDDDDAQATSKPETSASPKPSKSPKPTSSVKPGASPTPTKTPAKTPAPTKTPAKTPAPTKTPEVNNPGDYPEGI